MGLLGSAAALKWGTRELRSLDVVLELVKGRTAVVQAGGNLGLFPRKLAKMFQTVYTFEPAPDLFRMMLQNAPAHNIVAFQAALGAKRGLVGVSRERRDGKPDAHEGITHTVAGGSIPSLLIDDLGLPVLDLLYLDIEGDELPALMGAANTIRRCHPVIAVEVNKNLKYVGVTEAQIEAFFDMHGYAHALSVGSDRAYVSRAA